MNEVGHGMDIGWTYVDEIERVRGGGKNEKEELYM